MKSCCRQVKTESSASRPLSFDLCQPISKKSLVKSSSRTQRGRGAKKSKSIAPNYYTLNERLIDGRSLLTLGLTIHCASTAQGQTATPLVIFSANHKERDFRFCPPLQLVPHRNPTGELSVSYPAFCIEISADDQEGLLVELGEQVAFLWDEYAMSKPDSLTKDAQNFRILLLNRIDTSTHS